VSIGFGLMHIFIDFVHRTYAVGPMSASIVACLRLRHVAVVATLKLIEGACPWSHWAEARGSRQLLEFEHSLPLFLSSHFFVGRRVRPLLLLCLLLGLLGRMRLFGGFRGDEGVDGQDEETSVDGNHDDCDRKGALCLSAVSLNLLVLDDGAAFGEVPWQALVLAFRINEIRRGLHVESVRPKREESDVQYEREDREEDMEQPHGRFD